MSKRRKIKSSSKKSYPGGKGFISKKVSLVFYVLVLLLAVAARTYQLYYNMDFATGRYIDPSVDKNYTLMVLVPGLALIALILIAGSARDKVISSCVLINPMRLRYDRLNKKIPGSAGYSAILMAVLVGAQVFFDLFDMIRRNKEYMKTLPANEQKNYSKFTGYTLNMGLNHFLMLLVVLTFIAVAVNIFKGEGFSHANCAALSTYAIWQTGQIFSMASSHAALSLSSDTVYTMLSRMAAVVFFLNTARLFNGMERKTTRISMCFMGYSASILAAVSVIPRYIMLLIPDGRIEERMNMDIPDPADVGIVFMTITIVAVFWSTYVYRNMPKVNFGKRRWGRAPISKTYQEMETIE